MSLQSLIATGTKVWSDSIDPKVLAHDAPLGISGATSNPIIISELIETGGFDDILQELLDEGLSDQDLAWHLTDHMVHDAQETFWPAYKRSHGDDGYVSFELDPLLEDPARNLPHEQRVRQYIELGKKWSQGHSNRMIKVPATDAGLDALEELAAAGVTLNVTLCFTERQYLRSRDAIWKGAQRRSAGLDKFKSVYSIFVSRVDVYTAKHVPQLSKEAQGLVGIANAKHIWRMNQEFWKDKKLPLKQEIIFASTGVKLASDPPDKYVAAFAGSDIQTNPPATNAAVEKLNKPYTRQIDQPLPQPIVDEIAAKVDIAHMEKVLMEEGIEKFAKPQNALLAMIAKKRAALAR